MIHQYFTQSILYIILQEAYVNFMYLNIMIHELCIFLNEFTRIRNLLHMADLSLETSTKKNNFYSTSLGGTKYL